MFYMQRKKCFDLKLADYFRPVSVVLVFIACHTYRLAFRAFELAFPEKAILENFYFCDQEGKYHVPVVFYLMANLHYLFLTLNSSVNFIIYCCVGKEFRKHLKEIFHFWEENKNHVICLISDMLNVLRK